MQLKKTLHYNTLFDIYEKLLTKRQREVYIFYYHEDLSYQEIADILNISKAAVYDTVKRTTDFLEDTEKKLGINDKYVKIISELEKLNDPKVNAILEQFDRGGNYE
ncbi:MAG TPA: sigma factor-like helix-turn-helix DNA-binding protein [Erysipelothrix sp.]|nr:sigma factor-like helix-turn-helix DNA-binding protein [Erysipelothrix sp.]